MSNFIANIKGVNLLQAPRGMNNEGIALVTFDLVNQAQSGSGTDTVQLGGGGTLYGVTNTLTLAAIIASVLRDGATCTLDAVMPFGLVGYDSAGAAIFAGGTPTVSGQNVASIGLVTAAGGSSAKTTTSAAWTSAAGVVVAFHMSSAQ